MWLSDSTVAEHIHGSPQREVAPVRRARTSRSRWYAAPLRSLFAGALTVRTVMFWSRKKSSARKTAGSAASSRQRGASAKRSTRSGRPKPHSRPRLLPTAAVPAAAAVPIAAAAVPLAAAAVPLAAATGRRVSEPSAATEGRREAAVTARMTRGGPKSEMASRAIGERYRFERKAAVAWQSHAVSPAVLRARKPEPASPVKEARIERHASAT
mmetsp:Transcript_38240/g.124005  ORF Transcript_38240/g.124005 Transcript_38240/m.124005 type:complete len:212 (-) Transcript_38240:897-1532(-)